jgi:deoxyribodipyrimidine photolyase
MMPGVSKKKTARASNAKNQNSGSTQMSNDDAGGANVDKIRDILFGNQMRDYDRKFSNLEDRLLKEVSRVREESGKRLEALENFIKKELEAISDRQKNEESERKESLKALSNEWNKAAKDLDKKLSNLDAQFTTSTRDLRQQILDQYQNLSSEISSKYHELTEMQERIASELREDKVDRTALSALLTDLALRISGESLLDEPGGD